MRSGGGELKQPFGKHIFCQQPEEICSTQNGTAIRKKNSTALFLLCEVTSSKADDWWRQHCQYAVPLAWPCHSPWDHTDLCQSNVLKSEDMNCTLHYRAWMSDCDLFLNFWLCDLWIWCPVGMATLALVKLERIWPCLSNVAKDPPGTRFPLFFPMPAIPRSSSLVGMYNVCGEVSRLQLQ